MLPNFEEPNFLRCAAMDTAREEDIGYYFSIFHGGSKMKRIVLASVGLASLSFAGNALAADMAYKAAPMAPPPVYNWTGFYLGGNIGGGWGDLKSTELPPGSLAFPAGTGFATNNLSGVLGGVQGGYNWQPANNNFVFGVEGEYSWADLNGTATTISAVNGFNSTVNAKLKDIAMATGRLGFAANNWLLYAKAGGAWGQGNSFGTVTTPGGAFFGNTSTSTNRTGGVIGLGVEWGFASNWSAKLEYDHVDFGGSDISVASTASPTTFVHTSEKVDIVRAGVNYRFGWGSY
jgi:outer membrane immunogenic protein